MAGEQSSERMRSPRAPKHSLQQAIDYARKIYDNVHRSPINSTLAFELMGFQGKSGASATALGSVRQFGLIEGTGDKTRITDLALTIFEPASSVEYNDALVKAAEHPEIYSDIRTRFNDRLPSTNEPLRAYLIRERGFLKVAAEEAIRSLRETEEYISEVRNRPDPDRSAQDSTRQAGSQVVSGTSSTVPQSVPPSQANALSEPKPSHIVRLALTKECSAELRFEGEITERAVSNLIKYIDLMREVWAETDGQTPDR